MLNDAFTPYLEATAKILRGEIVEELETIRLSCNKAYLEKNSSEQDFAKHYSTGLCLSFATDAENKILQGEDPMDFYGDNEENRQFFRNGLELYVKLQGIE